MVFSAGSGSRGAAVRGRGEEGSRLGRRNKSRVYTIEEVCKSVREHLSSPVQPPAAHRIQADHTNMGNALWRSLPYPCPALPGIRSARQLWLGHLAPRQQDVHTEKKIVVNLR